jgi:hypothetical protein
MASSPHSFQCCGGHEQPTKTIQWGDVHDERHDNVYKKGILKIQRQHLLLLRFHKRVICFFFMIQATSGTLKFHSPRRLTSNIKRRKSWMYEGDKRDILSRVAGEVTRSCSCPQKTKEKVLTSCLHAKSDEDIDFLCHLANISVKNIQKAGKAHTYQCHMLRDFSNVYQCEHIIQVDDQCTSFWLVSRSWGLTLYYLMLWIGQFHCQQTIIQITQLEKVIHRHLQHHLGTHSCSVILVNYQQRMKITNW